MDDRNPKIEFHRKFGQPPDFDAVWQERDAHQRFPLLRSQGNAHDAFSRRCYLVLFMAFVIVICVALADIIWTRYVL
jgi:hypothetical protein